MTLNPESRASSGVIQKQDALQLLRRSFSVSWHKEKDPEKPGQMALVSWERPPNCRKGRQIDSAGSWLCQACAQWAQPTGMLGSTTGALSRRIPAGRIRARENYYSQSVG